MKKAFLLILLTAIYLSSSAQDLIVLKEGEVIKSKVIEIGINEIRYKKWSNPEGPSYVIEKFRVLSINYENGEVESFKGTPSKETATTHDNNTPSKVSASISSNNAELISKYNAPLEFSHFASKNKNTQHHIAKFAFTEGSVLSNEHVEVFFKMPYWCYYEIWLRNKTNLPIIVDLMNTFRSDSDGTSRTYYDASETTSVTSGEGTGASVNLGAVGSAIGIGGPVNTILSGISVGGGNSQSVTTTYSNDRYVIIPPKGSASISTWKSVVQSSRGSTDSKKWIKYGERFCNAKTRIWNYYTNNKGKFITCPDSDSYYDEINDYNNFGPLTDEINIGERRFFNPQDTPLRKDYSILYYIDACATHYTTISFSLFINEVIGYRNDIQFNPSHDFTPEYKIIGEYWGWFR